MGNNELIGCQVCEACGKYNLKPVHSCRNCGCSRVREVNLSGKGSLYSFTVIHVPPENWTFSRPYAVGLVSVNGEVLVTALYEGTEFDCLSLGVGVTVKNQNGIFTFKLAEKCLEH